MRNPLLSDLTLDTAHLNVSRCVCKSMATEKSNVKMSPDFPRIYSMDISVSGQKNLAFHAEPISIKKKEMEQKKIIR